jgi:hypothetical protein
MRTIASAGSAEQASGLALTNSNYVCLIVYSHTSNFSAIWWMSPLPVTGMQI